MIKGFDPTHQRIPSDNSHTSHSDVLLRPQTSLVPNSHITITNISTSVSHTIRINNISININSTINNITNTHTITNTTITIIINISTISTNTNNSNSNTNQPNNEIGKSCKEGTDVHLNPRRRRVSQAVALAAGKIPDRANHMLRVLALPLRNHAAMETGLGPTGETVSPTHAPPHTRTLTQMHSRTYKPGSTTGGPTRMPVCGVVTRNDKDHTPDIRIEFFHKFKQSQFLFDTGLGSTTLSLIHI